MSILGAVMVPHPPLIISTVGCGREQEVQTTIDAYRTAAEQVAAWDPEVLIITSPHQVMYADYFHISPGRGGTGDMSAFGAAQTKLRVEYDAPLRDEIIRCGEAAGLQIGTLGQRDPYLDHGTFVPLYFLWEAGVDCSILRIGLSGFSPLDHYRLGQCIAQAVESLGRRTVFVASGDLSEGQTGFCRARAILPGGGAMSCGGDHPPDPRRERQRGGDSEKSWLYDTSLQRQQKRAQCALISNKCMETSHFGAFSLCL